MFLQIDLGHKETFQFPGLLTTIIDFDDQILVRTIVKGRFFARVMNRFSREVSNEFPSKCDHTYVCLIAHSIHAGFALEGCSFCEVIRNYDVHTGNCSIVHSGFKPITICCERI